MKLNFTNKAFFPVSSHFPILENGQPMSAICPESVENYNGKEHGAALKMDTVFVDAMMVVTYKWKWLWFLPHERLFRFTAAKDQKGEFHWTPIPVDLIHSR